MGSRTETNWMGLVILGLLLAGAVGLGIYAIHKFTPKPVAAETVADCTGVSVVIDPQFVQFEAAKEAAGITTERIKLAIYIWDPDDQRLEFWLSDGTTIWQLEIVCFEKTDKYYPIYGQVQAVDFAELQARERAAALAEQQ